MYNVTFNTESLEFGESVVIFENIYDVATEEEIKSGIQKEDIEVVRHADLKNKDQTLKYNHLILLLVSQTKQMKILNKH